MDKNRKSIELVTDEKIAETSSKGNQEKWYDKKTDSWYKLDQFGYEALAETLCSKILEKSNIETDTPFTFVRYDMTRINAHGRDRTGCVSKNFLKNGQAIITLAHLLGKTVNTSLKNKLSSLSSDKKRIEYIAEMTREITGLVDFPKYLCLLFEIDSLFLNDDRHLNNIAVIEENGRFSYCPIFDNGAALLSNTQYAPMDVEPKALISTTKARPFNTTFTRQMNTARNLYGRQLCMPQIDTTKLKNMLNPMLEYYAERDRGYISDRVLEVIKIRQKYLMH